MSAYVVVDVVVKDPVRYDDYRKTGSCYHKSSPFKRVRSLYLFSALWPDSCSLPLKKIASPPLMALLWPRWYLRILADRGSKTMGQECVADHNPEIRT